MNLLQVIGTAFKTFFSTKEQKDNQTERALRNTAFVILCGLLSIIFYAIGVTNAAGFQAFCKTAVIGLLISGAALVIGALFGLLFGIPRSLQDGPVSAPALLANGKLNAAENNVDNQPSQVTPIRPEPAVRYSSQNTNLEQISDWLTKILVGVSLTQFQAIQTKFRGIAQAVARELNGAQEATGAALILFFMVSGFLISYLWVRRYLEKEFGDASRENQLIREARSEGIEEGKEAGIKEWKNTVNEATRLNAPLASLPSQPESQSQATETQQQASSALTKSVVKTPLIGPNPDDPWKGQFGGQANAKNRELSAEVQAYPGNPNLFTVRLRVKSTDPVNHPLSSVIFYLHPTFPNNSPVVAPGPNDIAELTIVAWGAFTVGAITDSGQTMLELDLAELPDAPEVFRGR